MKVREREKRERERESRRVERKDCFGMCVSVKCVTEKKGRKISLSCFVSQLMLVKSKLFVWKGLGGKGLGRKGLIAWK